MLIAAQSTFCQDTAVIWQFVGQILFVVKIVIPLIIILLGAIDLGKAVISNDEGEIKKSTTSLMKRFVAGIVIFFIPIIVSAVFSILSLFKEAKAEYDICKNCIVYPYNEAKCKPKEL